MSEEPKDNSREELSSALHDLLASKEHLSPDLKKELEELIALEESLGSEDSPQLKSKYQFEPSEDGMELWLFLFPSTEGEPRLEVGDILELMLEEGYQCELLIDDIETHLNEKRDETVKILAGRGSHPKNGRDGYLEFHVEEPNQNFLKEDLQERIDYRTHFRFIDVRKDQELLTVHPPQKGIPGKDVFGKIIVAKEGVSVSAVGGKNIQHIRETGVMYAAVDGCFLRDNNTFRVEDVFVVNGDLDMHVGNIDTHSRVLIHGNVLPGFSVRSSSDIQIMGNVEASNIISERGWVKVEGGVLGKHSSRIKAPKGFSCKFAQQALISSEGVIEVEDSLMFCTISCGDRLIVQGGKHSVIIGGSIRIHRSIEAATIGAPSEPLTTLTMGFDFSYEDELHRLDIQKVELVKSLEMLSEQEKVCERELLKLAKGSPALFDLKNDLIHLKKESLLLKVSISDLDKNISDVEQKALIYDQAWVRAKKSVHGNTLIRMCRVSHKVENEVSDALFELDPKNDVITVKGEDQ